ncbi:hypothetical protein ACLOJK_039593 [Asimina triloba]
MSQIKHACRSSWKKEMTMATVRGEREREREGRERNRLEEDGDILLDPDFEPLLADFSFFPTVSTSSSSCYGKRGSDVFEWVLTAIAEKRVSEVLDLKISGSCCSKHDRTLISILLRIRDE